MKEPRFLIGIGASGATYANAPWLRNSLARPFLPDQQADDTTRTPRLRVDDHSSCAHRMLPGTNLVRFVSYTVYKISRLLDRECQNAQCVADYHRLLRGYAVQSAARCPQLLASSRGGDTTTDRYRTSGMALAPQGQTAPRDGRSTATKE